MTTRVKDIWRISEVVKLVGVEITKNNDSRVGHGRVMRQSI